MTAGGNGERGTVLDLVSFCKVNRVNVGCCTGAACVAEAVG
jgi:hypothetical protein